MGSYDNRDKPAYPRQKINPEYAKNPHILKWWTPAHDDILKKEIATWAWEWNWDIAFLVEGSTPKEVMDDWRKADPLCSEYAWYNILMYFATSRAEQLGLTKNIRKPIRKKCPLCSQDFIESSLPVPLVKRLGIDHLNFCAPCLKDCVLQSTGNPKTKKEEILEYLNKLAEALGKVPNQGYGEGMSDFAGIDDENRLIIIKVLQTKPTVKRVKEVFGSWLNALVQAGILEDGTRRTSQGTQTIAKDGHVCLSLGEKTIDDFLFQRSITHEKEPHYPEGNYRGDFLVEDTFIEYFGLTGDPDYDEKTKIKKKICKAHGIPLISTYPADLVSLKKLENKMAPILAEARGTTLSE